MTTKKQIAANKKNAKKAGRKKGKKNPATLDKERVLAEYRAKIMRSAQKLFNAQMTLAEGVTMLYKIEKYYHGKGKARVLKHKSPKLVTEQWEIESYLMGIAENGEINVPGDTYYFIATKVPDNKSIDSMLDRTFGKAQQHVDLTSGGKSMSEILKEL